jgi:hypothetical protein
MMPSYVDSGRKTYHAENEGRAYWINYIDRPAAAPVGPDEMMAGLAWALADITCNFSIAAKANCDIHLSKKITLGAYPGVEYFITEDNCGKIYPGVIRAYATPNRIYTIMVTGGDENDPNAGKFLSSFKINK